MASPFKDVLHKTFEATRKDISSAILMQSSFPPTYPSLGPVMFFLADSTTGCIHNWSGTAWHELKLGWELEEVIWSALHIVTATEKALEQEVARLERVASQRIGQAVDSKSSNVDQKVLSEKSFRRLLEVIPDLVASMRDVKDNMVTDFDRYWEKERIHQICDKVEEVALKLEDFFRELDKLKGVDTTILQRYGMELPRARLDIDRIVKLLEKLIRITKGRHEALKSFENMLGIEQTFKVCVLGNCGNCSPRPALCRYIYSHPRLRGNKDEKEAVERKWNRYLYDLMQHSRRELGEEERTGLLVELFAFFPQEIPSSTIFDDLQRRMKKELSLRKDFEIVHLTDLSILKKLEYHPDYFGHFKLYRFTQALETLFYGGLRRKKHPIEIENAFVVPISFFDSQVIGQLVILSPDKISKSDCLNAVEKHYPEIQQAAKLDFYAGILEGISSDDRDFSGFASVLSRNLTKLLMLTGLIVWEGRNLIAIGFLEEDQEIRAEIRRRRKRERILHWKLSVKSGREVNSIPKLSTDNVQSLTQAVLTDGLDTIGTSRMGSWLYSVHEIQTARSGLGFF